MLVANIWLMTLTLLMPVSPFLNMQISGDMNQNDNKEDEDEIFGEFLKAPFINEATSDKFCTDRGKFQCISHRSYTPCLDFDQTCNNSPDCEDGSDEWCDNGLEGCKCLVGEFCNQNDHFCYGFNGTINRTFGVNTGSGSFLFEISFGDVKKEEDEEEEKEKEKDDDEMSSNLLLIPCVQNSSKEFCFENSFCPIPFLLILQLLLIND